MGGREGSLFSNALSSRIQPLLQQHHRLSPAPATQAICPSITRASFARTGQQIPIPYTHPLLCQLSLSRHPSYSWRRCLPSSCVAASVRLDRRQHLPSVRHGRTTYDTLAWPNNPRAHHQPLNPQAAPPRVSVSSLVKQLHQRSTAKHSPEANTSASVVVIWLKAGRATETPD